MPIFAAGDTPFQQTLPLGTICTQIWSITPGGSALTSPRDITMVNAGTQPIFVTSGSVITLTGVIVPAGGQLTIQGTAQTALWAMTGSGSSATIASLATTVAVV